jgi:glycosyltransferase involved in cell wall biosynthesis
VTRDPVLSVVVPARNAEATLGQCLASIRRCADPGVPWELVVVDNGSSDRTAAVARSHGARCVAEARRGRAYARNRGLEASRGSIVAFTDADCVATGGWLRELVRAFEDASVAAVAGEFAPFPPRTPAERYAAARHRWPQRDALASARPYAATANLAARREVFERLGGFDPFFDTAEDQDFGWRLFASGAEVAYRPSAAVLHRSRATIRGLFAQHAGWAYGAALLHARHGLPWGARRELAMWMRLAATAAGVARRAVLRLRGEVSTAELELAFCEAVRQCARRVGGLAGQLEARRRAGGATA